MNLEQIREILKTEYKCVSRNDCDRDCGKCDLVMDSEQILEAYSIVLQLFNQLESLKSEYKAYSMTSPYWQGVEHSLEVLNVKSLLY